MAERLQKILSACGICSRREAERLIEAGRVTINGAPAFLGMSADMETDEVAVDGRPVKKTEKLVYIMLNKPRGYVTTVSDEKGRKTVMELVRGCGARVYPVGRLDLNSEGLLLLTNDGELTNRLTHPSHNVDKTYEVEVSGENIQGSAAAIESMRELEGEPIRQAKVQIAPSNGAKNRLFITIHEGKNRQVRRMCAAAGLYVHRLKRVEECGLSLGELRPGHWRVLSGDEIRRLKNE